jgi:outer membrane lipoprotein carrier protein
MLTLRTPSIAPRTTRRLTQVIGIAALTLAPLGALASGIGQFKSFFGQTHSAQGSFIQSMISSPGRKPVQSSGTFVIQRPGKFRWSYDRPHAHLLVSDGAKLWSYDPELKQVTIKKMGESLGATPAALLAGDVLEQYFDLRDAGSEDGLELVDATPKAKEAIFQRVRIGMAGKLLMTMEIHDNFGQTTYLRFTRFQRNPEVEASQFTFTPPKGADIITDKGD